MKQKIKLVLSMLLVFVMLFTAAGCGGSDDEGGSSVDAEFFTDAENALEANSGAAANTDASANNSVPEANKVGGKDINTILESMPKNLKGTKVVMYNWNPISEYTGATDVVASFEKASGIKVQWQTVNYDIYFSKLASIVASGDSPDVVRTLTNRATNMQSFQPISVTGYDFTDKAWDQKVMKDYSVNGKVYATSLENTHIGSHYLMYYNKALIDKYNMDDPYKLWKGGKWTWKKFVEMAEEYREESGATYGATANNWDTWATCYGISGPLKYDGKKYTNIVTTPNFISTCQKIGDLYHTSKLIGHFKVDEFDRGEILFYAGNAIYGRRKNAYFAALKGAGTLYAVPMPKIDGQSKYYQGTSEQESYAIAKGAKNPKAVPYFLRYFLDAANYDMNAFFANKQVLEAYNWARSQKNTVGSTLFRTGSAGVSIDAFSDIVNLPGNQIKSFVDKNKALVDARADYMNEALNKLK